MDLAAEVGLCVCARLIEFYLSPAPATQISNHTYFQFLTLEVIHRRRPRGSQSRRQNVRGESHEQSTFPTSCSWVSEDGNYYDCLCLYFYLCICFRLCNTCENRNQRGTSSLLGAKITCLSVARSFRRFDTGLFSGRVNSSTYLA